MKLHARLLRLEAQQPPPASDADEQRAVLTSMSIEDLRELRAAVATGDNERAVSIWTAQVKG